LNGLDFTTATMLSRTLCTFVMLSSRALSSSSVSKRRSSAPLRAEGPGHVLLQQLAGLDLFAIYVFGGRRANRSLALLGLQRPADLRPERTGSSKSMLAVLDSSGASLLGFVILAHLLDGLHENESGVP
jgi:hypothetical protein